MGESAHVTITGAPYVLAALIRSVKWRKSRRPHNGHVIDEEGINDPVKVRSGHAAPPERGSHAGGWIKSLLEALTLFHTWFSHPRVQQLE